MTDLIARLRDADTTRRIGESYADTHERRQRDREEAAARIERLEKALREISKVTRGWEPGVWSEEEGRQYFAGLFFSAQKVARAAIAAGLAAWPEMQMRPSGSLYAMTVHAHLVLPLPSAGAPTQGDACNG